MQVSFLGLGAMGFPMAGHLAEGGHSVKVYNRTASKSARWCEQHKGEAMPTPRQAAEGSEIVFLCLGADEDVRDALNGENGVFAGATKDTLVVDHTTTSAEFAREAHATAQKQGIAFMDAPVSGGDKGAQAGTLSVMCGGDEKDFARAEPVMNCYASQCRHMGEIGSGQLTKMVNQICNAGVIQGLAEGLHFAKQAGLDRTKLLQVIRKGAAQSWWMDNVGATMCEGKFDFGFACQWILKDLRYCVEEAERNGAPLEMVAMIVGFYEELVEGGKHRHSDSSALIARFE